METAYFATAHSPVGPLTVGCSERGLLHLGKGMPNGRRAARFHWVESEEKTRRAVRELEEYFAGRRKRFTVPLDLRGTPFQTKVWKALLEIPYGQTRSYGEIARSIGHPRAFRAVGMANHWNPVAIVVPCHRVLAAGGALGGYGGGLGMKQFLLDLEFKVQSPPDRKANLQL